MAVRAIASGGGLTPLGILGLPARAALSLYALGFYLAKLLWPTCLSPLYELALPVRPLAARLVLSALGVVAVTGAALLLRRRWPGFLAARAAFALTPLPVLGIAHSGYQAAADRYTYLACLGFSALAGGAFALWRRWALWPAALGLAALAALTWIQVPVWRSDESLWRRAVKLEPGSVAELERAVALRPGYAEAWNNLGPAWAQQGRPEEAVEGFRRAVAVRPRFVEAWNNLGVAAALQGQGEAAMDVFRRAAAADPSFAGARNNLGQALAREGRVQEAAEGQACARDQSVVCRDAAQPRAGGAITRTLDFNRARRGRRGWSVSARRRPGGTRRSRAPAQRARGRPWPSCRG